MMMIAPVEQYSNNYVLNVLPEFETNFITLYVIPEDYQPQNIIVDDTNLENANWTEVLCSDSSICGYITYVALTPGEHQVHHVGATARVGVSAYGFNVFNSYGYPGGLQLAPLQCKSNYFMCCNCSWISRHNLMLSLLIVFHNATSLGDELSILLQV